MYTVYYLSPRKKHAKKTSREHRKKHRVGHEASSYGTEGRCGKYESLTYLAREGSRQNVHGDARLRHITLTRPVTQTSLTHTHVDSPTADSNALCKGPTLNENRHTPNATWTLLVSSRNSQCTSSLRPHSSSETPTAAPCIICHQTKCTANKHSSAIERKPTSP